MNKEELIKELTDEKIYLLDKLAYINGKHDTVVEEVARINSLIERLSNEKDDQTSHAES